VTESRPDRNHFHRTTNYVQKGQEYTYAKHGFIATAYELPTDQYGTQLDPPGHWDEYGATISDLPATFAIRPLVVIDTHAKERSQKERENELSSSQESSHPEGRLPPFVTVCIQLQIITNNLT
jgi:kynurenine formamidase